MTHLDALLTRLSNERARLSRAGDPGEIEMRTIWVAQIEREVSEERARLGLEADPADEAEEMTDEEILDALFS